MIKISLKALTRILLESGHRYTVDLVKEFPDSRVMGFFVSKSYPSSGHFTFMCNTSEETLELRDSRNRLNGSALLYYDMSSDSVMACQSSIYNIIQKAKNNAITKESIT